MYALFLILNQTEYLDDILAGFMEIGVKGATILDSQGMGSAIVINENRQVPLFGSLKSFLDSERPYNKTIFTILESEELVHGAVEVVNDVVGDLNKPGVGLMFTVPTSHIFGIRPNYDDK